MEFLTPGQKIRNIRIKLNMNQQDLVSENITRPLISMIETGKRNLTYDTANTIMGKFNKKAKKLGIDLNIDIDYLLRHQYEDANIYCLQKLKNNNINNVISEVLQISDKFNLLEVKAIAYKAMGDLYFDNKSFIESFIKYINSIDVYKEIKKNEDIPYLYWKSGLCKTYLLQYKEALTYFNLSRYYSILYDNNKIRTISLYHIAECYIKLYDINSAKIHINNYLYEFNKYNKSKNSNYYINANILRANCDEIEERFDRAIVIYKSLISEIQNFESPLLGIIYNNLGLAYFYKNEFNKSIKYFDMAIELRTKLDKFNLSHTLIEKSNILLHEKLYTEAIKTLELGLKYAEMYNDIQYLVKGNYMLANVYNALNDNNNLEKIYLKIAVLLQNTDSLDIILIYNKLLNIYLDQNNFSQAKKYALLCQDLIRNNVNLLYCKGM
ncbi:helix-turn-helix domain-containing protein [Clostridium sp. BJN0013]|uniref:helix-turn-helix domain-containing protein n=1 Tax=Clostridium sp. BJN0013 TaxID=3236840 RepID=UPI0034C5E050